MREQERSVVLTINAALASQVLAVFVFFEMVLEGASFELTIPSYTQPEVSGKRSPERQLAYIDQGKSWWKKKNVANAPHVLGRAIHLGFRYKRSGKYIPFDSYTPTQRAVWDLVVFRMKALGWRWLGKKDAEHFDKL